MRSISIILSIILVLSLTSFGCGGGSGTMKQPTEKTPGGLAQPEPLIDPDEQGNAAIDITSEVTYPGMENRPGMHYEFVSKDAPEVVAAWYESNLSGSIMRKTITEEAVNTFWTVTWNDITIKITYINETESMIKFSTDT